MVIPLVLFVVLFSIGWLLLQRYCRFLLQTDARIGKPAKVRDGKAIVLGSGMAGLGAAAMLSYHFKEVHIYEADDEVKTLNTKECTSVDARKGVGQGDQPHTLLTRGSRILNCLFPNINKEIEAQGVEYKYFTNGIIDIIGKSFLSPPDAPIVTLLARPFLESIIRKRMQSDYPNVIFHYNCVVKHLLSTKPNQITGISYLERKSKSQKKDESEEKKDSTIENKDHEDTNTSTENSTTEKTTTTKKILIEVEADLIIDATGQTSKIETWISELGYPSIPTEKINAHFCYRTFQITGYQKVSIRNHLPGKISQWASIPNPATNMTRGFATMATGIPDHMYFTLMSAAKDDVSNIHTKEDLLNWSQTLDTTLAYEVLTQLIPNDYKVETYTWRPIGNAWRRCDKWKKVPEGLIVLGDALCTFNPFYGQGMTTALIHVTALDAQLRKQMEIKKNNDLTGLPQRFYRDAFHLNIMPFFMAAITDSYYKGAKISWSESPLLPPSIIPYANKMNLHLFHLCCENMDFARFFIQVSTMEVTPFAMYHPKILFPLLWRMLTKKV